MSPYLVIFGTPLLKCLSVNNTNKTTMPINTDLSQLVFRKSIITEKYIGELAQLKGVKVLLGSFL